MDGLVLIREHTQRDQADKDQEQPAKRRDALHVALTLFLPMFMHG